MIKKIQTFKPRTADASRPRESHSKGGKSMKKYMKPKVVGSSNVHPC